MRSSGFGGNIPFVPVFVLRMYGEKYFPTNYSVYYINSVISSLIGPAITAAVYSRYNDYFPAFLVLLAFCCIGTMIKFPRNP